MTERRAPAEAAGPGNLPTESRTITFEWPLTGIKSIFEEPNEAIKAKAVQSAHFGDGRWTVLFYTHRPGVERNKLSLYINAMPQEDEYINPLIIPPAGAGKQPESRGRHTPSSSQGAAEASASAPVPPRHVVSWIRKGSVHFTISLLAPVTGKLQQLASKEASDHTFSNQSPNWGWSKFCSHDVVLSSAPVMELDKLIISVSITTHPSEVRSAPPTTAAVPRQLLSALSSMLDDPQYSDIVFCFPAHTSRNGPLIQRQERDTLHAIKQLLTARSEYFNNLLSGDFLEAGGDTADIKRQDDAVGPEDPKINQSDFFGLQDPSSRTGKKPADAMSEADGDDDLVSQDEQGEGGHAPKRLSTWGRGPTLSEPAAPRTSSPNCPSLVDYAAYQPDVDAFPDSDAEYDFDETWIDPELNASTPNSYPPSTSAAIDLMDEIEDDLISARPFGPQSNASLRGRSTPDSGSHQLEAADPTITLPAFTSSSRSATPHRKRKTTAQRTHQSQLLEGVHARKAITIPGVAPRTYRALLHFLYTDQIEFAPLTSSYITSWTQEALHAPLPGGAASPDLRFASKSARARLNGLRMLYAAHKERRRQIDRYMVLNPEKLEPVSAKSVFRLADQLDLPDLRARAMAHIVDNLTVDNVSWELFSHFTSSIPVQDLRGAEMAFFLSSWNKIKSNDVMKTIFSSHTFHPGLGHVFPLLLEQLDYRGTEPGPDEPPAMDP